MTRETTTRASIAALVYMMINAVLFGVGIVKSLNRPEANITGLALSKAADALEITGAIDAGVRQRAYELGGTLAATLME